MIREKTAIPAKPVFMRFAGVSAGYAMILGGLQGHISAYPLCYNIDTAKERKTKRDNLTYANMITFINCQNNAEILLKEFEKVKELASGQGGNVYQNVKRWFLQTFPNYKDIPSFDEAGNLTSDFGRRTETKVFPVDPIVRTNEQEELKSA